eukprot:TRINITY_DN5926_c0_g1_i1.p1 TRINITY_DN5926_c0_g1~~TRINITY_DN5926_c0_g1_i1.p1  ORF type:complete len:705 (+),score=161.83 TRINITY_DN5926_c0_g1_i1:27-2117(+)
MASSTSFGTYEPSDALLEAMKARFAAKQMSDRVGQAAPDAGSGAASSSTAPSFRLAGGGMGEMPGQTAEKEVATAGGITFGIKEASKGYAPELFAASEPPLRAGGGLFQVASGPGPPLPPEAEATIPAVASAASPRASGGARRGNAGPASAEKKRSKGGASSSSSSSSSSAALRGQSPLARGPSASRGLGPMPSSSRRQAAFEHPSQFFAEPGLGSQVGTPAGAGASLLPPPMPPESASAGPSRPPTGRLSGRPPSAPPVQSSRLQHQEVASMQDAADQAFARAMAQAGAGLPALEEVHFGSPHGFEEDRQHYSSPPRPPQPMISKLPSAVTVAGVPVAAQGDLIYLGGGLYASAVPPAEKQASRKKSSTQPSRGPRPPRRPLGAAVRSASAHLLGHQGDESPTPSRARSDGQLGLGRLNRAPGGAADAAAQDSARGPPQHGSGAGSVASSALVPPGPKHWRPSGVQKLPPAKLEPPTRAYRLGLEEAGQIPGSHAEARADARNSKAKEGVALFGSQGVLSQLREMDTDIPSRAFFGPVSGPPTNVERRQEERRAAKEAKIQQMLEERAIRLATEAAVATQKRQHAAQLARNASAPELGGEDLEKQRMRLACKMEILDFFNGYSNSVKKLTSEQKKVLHAKLHGVRADFPEDCQGDESNEDDRDDSFHEEPSLQDRLQQVNEQCNRVFQSPPEVPA